MQIKVFSVPVVSGEAVNDELNAFLRGNKILQVEQQLVASAEGTYWSFCIRYIGKSSGSGLGFPLVLFLAAGGGWRKFCILKWAVVLRV